MKQETATIIGDDQAQEELPALSEMAYFPSMVYTMMAENFLDSVSVVSEEYINKAKETRDLNEVYPVYMTDNFAGDERIINFVQFISQVAWDILNRQGYAMSQYNTVTHELWCQDHHKFSGMDQHIHGSGCQISGFYFLKCYEDSPRVVIHDPRAAKMYADLPEQNPSLATVASQAINFMPVPGQLMFTNSWLPHSFSKNSLEESFRFIHFNISLVYNTNFQPCVIDDPTII